eukprot:15336475-Ditylum_brightwellii.AAC.1
MVNELVTRATDWSTTLTSSSSPRNLARLNFNCCIWRSITYPLLALSLSDQQGNDFAKALLQSSLLIMGVERSFPKDMRFSLATFFGLNIPHPCTENSISKISLWIHHSTSNTVLGHYLCTSYKYFLLKINHPGCLFEATYERWSFLATDCWVKDLWRFVYENQIHLRGPPLAISHIKRVNDQFFLPWFYSLGASKEKLLQLNCCRMVLQVVSLADIALGDSLSLLSTALSFKTWSGSSIIAD